MESEERQGSATPALLSAWRESKVSVRREGALIGLDLSRVAELDRNPLSASLCPAVLGRVVWRRSAAGRGRAATEASSVADESVVVLPTACGRVVGMKLG